jgi:hypothetical protein
MDPAMTGNPSSDPQLDEACRQVGGFLYHFGLLEEALNALIGKALELDENRTAIVGSSVSFYKKIELLQAAIQAQPHQDETWKQKAVSTLNKITKYNGCRNIVAHHAFCGDPSGGVIFRYAGIDHGSKALKKELKLWTRTDFKTKCESIDRITGKLEKLKDTLVPVVAALEAVSATVRPTFPVSIE